MPASVKPVPEGFHTVTPSLTVKGAAQAIEFYKKALGAQEIMRMPNPDGTIGHAELKIGDSIIFLGDEMNMPGCSRSPQSVGGTTGGLYLYVEDVDTSFQRAVDAGGKVHSPVQDMFWGDRHGSFVDPFGHTWSLSTHKYDLSEKEIEEGAKKWQAQMAEMAEEVCLKIGAAHRVSQARHSRNQTPGDTKPASCPLFFAPPGSTSGAA